MPSNMAQRNQANRVTTDSTEESERQPETSGDNDEKLTAEDEIPGAQEQDLTAPAATMQPTVAENSAYLEPTLEHSHGETASNMTSTSQRRGPGAKGGSQLECTSLEASADVESPSHSNKNAAVGDQELSQLGAIILQRIREELLFKLAAPGTKHAPGLCLRLFFLTPKLSIMLHPYKKVDILRAVEPEPLPDAVANAIRDDWPQRRDCVSIVQTIVESDGTMPVTEVSWQSVGEDFQQRYDWLSQQGFQEERKRDVRFSAYESLWHRWCLCAAQRQQEQQGPSPPDNADVSSLPSKFRGQIIYGLLANFKKDQHMFPLVHLASVLSYDEPFLLPHPESEFKNEYMKFDMDLLLSFVHQDFQSELKYPFHPRQFLIQFQLRYFCPVYEDNIPTWEQEFEYPCVLGDRQRAIIGQGSAIQYLEEKRVRVTLRVSHDFPGLFNVTVLTDELRFVIGTDFSHDPDDKDSKLGWARYGLMPCGKGTATTHYMFEVSSVLEKSLVACSKALDSIDKVVHVNLSDFEDEKRVEDLMFDKSFTRSKDYFVAIQLLRIMDEWLDEILLSIDDLREMPVKNRDIFCVKEAKDNINVATKNMKERITRFQNRIRKKSEEIKSLRDGLFNATSLREATKAMALNQAIYVFTVVTVLFTPVSFLATFWALPFLNNPAEEGSDMVPEPASFRISFIAMPLLTYALVIGIAWYMRPDQSRYRLPHWLTGIWDTARQTLRTAWDSFPREIKRERKKAQGGSDAGDSA